MNRSMPNSVFQDVRLAMEGLGAGLHVPPSGSLAVGAKTLLTRIHRVRDQGGVLRGVDASPHLKALARMIDHQSGLQIAVAQRVEEAPAHHGR
jgi:hypothetical protein